MFSNRSIFCQAESDANAQQLCCHRPERHVLVECIITLKLTFVKEKTDVQTIQYQKLCF